MSDIGKSALKNLIDTAVVENETGAITGTVMNGVLQDTVDTLANGENLDAGSIKTANIADGAITTAKVANGAITEGKIGSGAVTSGKIGDGAVTAAKIGSKAVETAKLDDAAVTTAKIADGAVTADKVGAGAVTAGKIGAKAVTTAKLDDKAVTTAKVDDSAITTDKIANANVTTAKINDGAVSADKIGSSAVTEAKIADGAVTSDKIAAGGITSAKINDGAVTTGKVADGAITADKLATGAVTTAKIYDGNVTGAKIADSTITGAKIASNTIETGNIKAKAVTTAKIDDAAVDTAQIKDSAVTTDKLATSAVTTVKVNDGAVTTAKIASSAVTTAKIADANVTTAKIADSNVTAAKIGANAVETAKIKDGNVTTAKLDDEAVTTAKIADEAITTAKVADGAITDDKLANPISVSQDAEAGTTTITVGEDSYDVATEPVSVSQNTSTGHIDITIGDITIPVANAVIQDRIKSSSVLASMSMNTDVLDTFVAANEQVATLKQNIILAKDGDSIEFTLKSCSYASSDNRHNAFAYNPIDYRHISMGVAINYVSARADDGTWVIDKIVDALHSKIKISYENGNIVLYCNDVAESTYIGQKQITISSFGNGSTFGYWGGSIENLKINGILVSLKDLCQTFTATESVTAHKFTPDELSNIADIPNIKSDIDNIRIDMYNLEKSKRYTFDSAQESYFELTNPIVLSQNGDSLELKIDNVPLYYGADTTKAYCLGYNPNNLQKIAIGASMSVIGVRADDGTWLCDIAAQNSLANGDVLKISYEDGNVVTYKNGIVIATYTGQKTLTISSFGNGSQGSGNYGYWDGTISNIKVNGNNYVLTGTNHNVSVEDVASVSIPQMLIEKSANVITLYLLYKGNQYIGYPINYRYKAYTADEYPSFYDNWGVERLFLADYDTESNSMTFNQYLFAKAEAELAIETANVKYGETGQAQYKFSGGVMHGFENMVTEDGARKFMLLINNISYAESSVIPLTEISSFDLYTQTQIYQAYTNENPYGLVNKHWFIKDGLFQIRTTMKMLRSIYLNQSEFGMFGVYRHAEGGVDKPYLTNRAIENDNIFKAYDVSDGWESVTANNVLKTNHYPATEMILYGQEDMGFSMKIIDANTVSPTNDRNGGGLSMATNGGNAYNKVYFDLTGHYTPNVDDELFATQIWSVN